jgi:hypothetical protein
VETCPEREQTRRVGGRMEELRDFLSAEPGRFQLSNNTVDQVVYLSETGS